jgi:hypothetical protein
MSGLLEESLAECSVATKAHDVLIKDTYSRASNRFVQYT